jgi:hypothetical protein
LDNLNAIQMPKMPPIELPSSEIIRSSLPKSDGIYPPATEPITMPNIIIFFRDIAVHFKGKVRGRNPRRLWRLSQKYFYQGWRKENNGGNDYADTDLIHPSFMGYKSFIPVSALYKIAKSLHVAGP